MRRLWNPLFLLLMAADPGGGGGGTPADPPKDPVDPPKVTDPADDGDKGKDESAELKKKLKAEETARKAAEKKLADAERAKLTDEERQKAEIDEAKTSLLSEHRALQLKALGISEDYMPLLSGSSAEEIKKAGELLDALIKTVTADTEARVKKEVAKTTTPGGTAGDDDKKEVNPANYFRALLNRKKGAK